MWEPAGEVEYFTAPDEIEGHQGKRPKTMLARMPVRQSSAALRPPNYPTVENGQGSQSILPALANPTEVGSFATAKRFEEHLAGRYLLGEALKRWGVANLASVEVVRDEHRSPSLAWIQGTYQSAPLPSISISHSEGWAVVALCQPSHWIGIDAEPVNRKISATAFEMMAKGEELEKLSQTPELALPLWTAKEAVQKALHLGMHLNPREIYVESANLDGVFTDEVSIGKSIIQLDTWQDTQLRISLALTLAKQRENTLLDNLMEATATAMSEHRLQREDGSIEYTFGVGCETPHGGK